MSSRRTSTSRSRTPGGRVRKRRALIDLVAGTGTALPLPARLRLVWTWSRLGRTPLERLLARARRLRARYPRAGGPAALEALCLLNLGLIQEALHAAREGVMLEPGIRKVEEAAGTVAFEAKEFGFAAERFAAAVAAAPEDATVRVRLAEAQLELGRPEEALGNAEAAVSRDPESVRGLAAKGRALERLGRFEEAIDPLEKAVRNGVRPLRVLNAFVRSLEATKRGDEAIRILDRYAPGHVRAALLARLCVRLKRHPEAEKFAGEAVAGNPEEPLSHYARATVLRARGELSEALSGVRAARKIEDRPRFESFERRVEGLQRTLSGDWLPTVPGTARAIDPAAGRVLHLLDRSMPHTLSGFAVRSLYTVKAQREIGLDPVVATRLGIPRIAGVEDFPAEEQVEGVPHFRLDAPDIADYAHVPRDVYLERYAAEAATLVERLRPSVLHPAGGHVNGQVALALGRHFGLPVVYEVRNFYGDLWASELDQLPGTELYEGRARAETQCMRGADRVVTLAESMKQDIAARGIDPERIVVVPNAVDVERFAPRAPDPALRASLGLDGVVVGYVSGLRRYEGIDVLLRGLAEIIRRGLPVTGLIVGDGEEYEPLRTLTDELGIAGRVRLTGAVPHDRVLDYYALIDVFVVPRRNDRVGNLITPLKPFEAMAMGIPLLVSDLDALREVAAPGERGLAFVPEDPSSLAAEAERLVNDEGLRRRLGEAGRRWVRRERSWRANAEIYRALYEDILAERARRSSI